MEHAKPTAWSKTWGRTSHSLRARNGAYKVWATGSAMKFLSETKRPIPIRNVSDTSFPCNGRGVSSLTQALQNVILLHPRYLEVYLSVSKHLNHPSTRLPFSNHIGKAIHLDVQLLDGILEKR